MRAFVGTLGGGHQVLVYRTRPSKEVTVDSLIVDMVELRCIEKEGGSRWGNILGEGTLTF